MRSHLKIAVISLLSLAASSAVNAQSQPALIAPSADSAAVPSFQVATIKLNTSGGGGGHSGFGLSSDQFTTTNVTLKWLLRFEAFGIADARIVGGPKWLDSARFDIDAKLDAADASHLNSLAPEKKNTLEQMLVQSLLADRFQFKAHWEDREQPVYALTVAKSGSRLQPADTKHSSGYSSGPGTVWGTDLTLGRFCDLLTQSTGNELGRVVVDRTGIEGAFAIRLRWAPDTGAASSNAPTGPSIFTAIQEQLGLKLEPAKAPVKVLIIDRLEMPSDN